MVSESQKKANQKWDQENREKKNYIVKRSVARNFIKKIATDEDIEELQNLINERRQNNDD